MITAEPSISYVRPPLTVYQEKAFFDPARFVWIEGTTKTGKNHGGLTWLFEKALLGNRKNYWWAEPVYPQSKISYERLKLAIPPELRRPNDSDLTLTLPRTIKDGKPVFGWAEDNPKIFFKSGEKPDNLYGEDVGAAVVNEASRFREQSWWAIRSTLTQTQGPARIMGNLKGTMNWFFYRCRKAEGMPPDSGEAYFKFISQQAVEAGILPQAEIDQAKSQLPESIFNELYLGIPSEDGGNPFGIKWVNECLAPVSASLPVVYGVDLAKSEDWTVLIGLDERGTVCRFQRFRLPWQETIARIRAEVKGIPTLVDSTGVGDPVLEELQRNTAGYCRFEGYKFTSESKQKLMEGLAVAIQSHTVHYPEGPIVAELRTYGYEYTRTGVVYCAPEGMYDDCVCSLALAVEHFRGHRGMKPTAGTSGDGIVRRVKPDWE